MGQPLGEHARRAARAYGAAADHYRLPSLGFWDRFGAATVSRLGLAAGDRVLDLCCGAGASAIPAARAVGSTGHVLGIDVAAPLLELARARAAGECLANVEFRHGDATCADLPASCFDAVICVFGLYSRAGAAPPATLAVPGQHHLDALDGFWDIVLGSGYRATVDALSQEQRDRVRERVLGELQARKIATLRTDVVFGTAQRPA